MRPAREYPPRTAGSATGPRLRDGRRRPRRRAARRGRARSAAGAPGRGRRPPRRLPHAGRRRVRRLGRAARELAHRRNSGPVDRFYFRSLYFREPNGILFEIATDGPGFATDEPLETLGERLALPPFLEPRRAAIEAGLKPL